MTRFDFFFGESFSSSSVLTVEGSVSSSSSSPSNYNFARNFFISSSYFLLFFLTFCFSLEKALELFLERLF